MEKRKLNTVFKSTKNRLILLDQIKSKEFTVVQLVDKWSVGRRTIYDHIDSFKRDGLL